MASEGFLAKRLDAGTWPLAVGDVLVIALVLAAGTAHHHGVAFLQTNPLYLAGVLAPFLVGWAVASVPLGAYSPGAGESAKSAVPLALRAWLVADLLGLGLRATPLFRGGVEPVFAVVTVVTGGVALAAWRYLAFAVR
jgi:hypothetical protein